jgi:hypothetical protein
MPGPWFQIAVLLFLNLARRISEYGRMRNLPKALILAASITSFTSFASAAPPPSDVFVTNPATQPVPVQVALPEPFQRTINQTFTDLFANFTIEVPAGKRLVIESVSVRAQVPTGQKVYASVSTNSPLGVGTQFLPMFPQGTFAPILVPSGGDIYVANQACLLYGQGPNGASFHVVRSAGTGSSFAEVALTGHLEPAP